MAEFNWNDGPFELVRNGVVYPNIKFEHHNDGTTKIMSVDELKLFRVWTVSGDTFKDNSYLMGNTFVRQMPANLILSMSDEAIAKEIRILDERFTPLLKEMLDRGYSFELEDDDLEVVPSLITRIFKNTVTEL